ncbi:FAD-dependent oxidoreductase [Allorhizocola rhizosphaerae]|uniref:FAD-dependent oxidoreductase n=1 Tax=Allorhizocola rhizosphaerae TaxID=1872709 RepID=UPI001FEB7171|nr:FAD-dependent oxidoreductase [Allorhizocola rhizosphaerae]
MTGDGGKPVRMILRMRVRQGREAEFERVWREAAAEISRVRGNLRQELSRDTTDTQTYVITSEWTDQETLELFGRSAARDRLTAALREMRESADRSTLEVVHVVEGQPLRIRVAVKVTVPEGKEEAYERAYLKVAERMRGTPGHTREELLREVGTNNYVLFAEWENETAFNAWADDPAHMDQTAPLLPYLLESFERTTFEIVARPEEQLPDIASEVKVPELPPTPVVAVEREAPGERVDTDVLVVGAGPAGLTLAIELARRGVDCRLIEKRTEPSSQADKAIGIQCRTMEIWEDIGVVQEAMDVGAWLHGQTVFVNGRQTHQVDWDLPEVPYAHLALPQYETERILAGCLSRHGGRVERGMELVGLTQDASGVTAHIKAADGGRSQIRARYVVGCDGAHSTVRQCVGATFEGGMGMFPQLFMIGDVELNWTMPEGHLLRFIHVEDDEMKGMLVCVPLRGPGRYRVATLAPPRIAAEVGSGPIPPGFSQEYAPPALSDIQAVLDELAPAGATASNLRWSSIFRIKHGIVDRYREGRVFLAGDAAHLHPPAGGQGMNTGIQDSWNLGWKLAYAVRGQASAGLLDSYEAERRPAGKSIVDRAVRVAFTDEMDMEDEKLQFLTDMQMTLTYAGSHLVGELVENGGTFEGGPAPGDRAPDVEQLRRFGVSHPLRLFDLTRGTAHTLLVYADVGMPEPEIVEYEKLAAKVRAQGPGLVNVYVIAHPGATVPALLELPVLRDAADGFRSAYGVRGSGAYLIRPDGHVGFRCAPVSATAIDEHLFKVFAI